MTHTELTIHPVFNALTRPAMTGGVTFEFHGLNLIVSVSAFIAFNNLLYGFIFIPLHVFGWCVCRHDVCFFAICLKRLSHLPAMPNQSFWGVRCYEPC